MKIPNFVRCAVLSAFLPGTFLSAQTPLETKPLVLQPPPQLPSQATVPQNPQLTKEDVAAFLDGVVPIQLQKGDIAGAVVTVVKDGQVLFAKGYGFSDMKTRKPVSVDDTLFRPGSISKTFTWTAVMQLVEQDKIDLDRDVNEYIDFKVPAPFGKPVTMRDLMTHTPGWQESIKELFVADASDLYPLNSYLKKRLPRQIFPPGTTPAYSNYGAALAGYIVSRISGMPFEEYVEKNILHPLGMTHSTFRQPLPENLKPLMSEGYDNASEPAKNFEFVEAYPAGSLSASAADMARFMIAHLQNGEYQGNRILKPETAQLMRSRAFGLAPEMNGIAYGFYEETANGHRIIGHGGDTQWFHSDIHLMPDQNLGFFVSYNSAGKGEGSPRNILWRNFLDRYYPYSPPQAEKVASAESDAKSLAGNYWSSRRSDTTVISAGSLVQDRVSVNPDGTISLTFATDFAGNLKHFREIAPMLFREEHGQSRLAFVEDYAGRRIIVTDLPVFVLQPVPWRKVGRFNLTVLIFSVAIFALMLLFLPVNALLRRHYGQRLEHSVEYRRARRWVCVVCVLNLGLLAALGIWIAMARNNIGLLSSHFDGRLRVVEALALLDVLGAFVGVWYFARAWQEADLWFWTKVWSTLLMLACVGYAFFLVNWHLFNFSVNY